MNRDFEIEARSDVTAIVNGFASTANIILPFLPYFILLKVGIALGELNSKIRILSTPSIVFINNFNVK